jgi:hypothetical protein
VEDRQPRRGGGDQKKGGSRMKRTIFTGALIFLCAQMVFGQEKIETPIWNVGDKWTFTQGMKMEVLETDENSYIIDFSNQTMVFGKSNLNKLFILQGKKREPYRGNQKRFLDFPLVIGKSWKDHYSETLKWEDTYTGRTTGSALGNETQIFENYKVFGWEDVEVRPGKFKAIKIEYRKGWTSPETGIVEGKAWYWYSPEVKNVIRYQYDKSPMWAKFSNWELVSYYLMK